MNITFLGQGFNPSLSKTVGDLLIKFLTEKQFHTFWCISAFASEAGVIGLSEELNSAKKHFKHLNLIVGIDQCGTSKEALLEINNLRINSFIFYQNESPIFHPKIYLFEGNDRTKLILGSSNLTARGLFRNVESSILLDFSKDDTEGVQFLSELKRYYNSLFDLSDHNLFKINKKTIRDFVELGIIPKESTRTKLHGKSNQRQKKEAHISLSIEKRPTEIIPHRFRGRSKPKEIISKIVKEFQITSLSKIDPETLVWQKKNLPRSDAQQVSGNTAITGVVRFGTANFKQNGQKIDRNVYFRNNVFAKLKWTNELRKNKSALQVSYCNFLIYLKGLYVGKYNLKISHDSERIADQNNVPTTLHWGPQLNHYFRKHDISGKTLKLYSPSEGSGSFRIIIE